MVYLSEADSTDEGSATNALLVRARAALQALSDGKVRAASGIDSVDELQDRLRALSGQKTLRESGIDLREVQESVVEHAAMYANCSEVLGGMLQLVFCLDHFRNWLEQRDLDIQEGLAQLDTLRRDFEDSGARITQLGTEVRTCVERASEFELELATRAGDAASSLARSATLRSPLAAKSLRNVVRSPPGSGRFVSVDLHALEMSEENEQIEQNFRLVEELREEIKYLRDRLTAANAEAAAARNAAEVAKNAAEETAAAAATVLANRAAATASNQELRPASSPLEILEQLEPLLAGLPVGIVPGMSELQEEACDVYGHLRSLLMKAAKGVPAEGLSEQMLLPTSQKIAAREATDTEVLRPGLGQSHETTIRHSQAASLMSIGGGVIPSQHPQSGLLTWRSTSVGTSEEKLDSWRTWPATVISDPIRGIGPSAGISIQPYPVNVNRLS